MSLGSSSYRSNCELSNSIYSRLLEACTSFVLAVCSSHVCPHFPCIQSSCVFCLCSCHLWYNQLYRCRVNQSRTKIKAHLLPLSLPPGMNRGLKDGSVCVCECVFSLQVPVCVHVANGAYDLLFLGSAAPHFHTCHFFHGLCPQLSVKAKDTEQDKRQLTTTINKHLQNTSDEESQNCKRNSSRRTISKLFHYEKRPIIAIWVWDTVNLWLWLCSECRQIRFFSQIRSFHADCPQY